MPDAILVNCFPRKIFYLLFMQVPPNGFGFTVVECTTVGLNSLLSIVWLIQRLSVSLNMSDPIMIQGLWISESSLAESSHVVCID